MCESTARQTTVTRSRLCSRTWSTDWGDAEPCSRRRRLSRSQCTHRFKVYTAGQKRRMTEQSGGSCDDVPQSSRFLDISKPSTAWAATPSRRCSQCGAGRCRLYFGRLLACLRSLGASFWRRRCYLTGPPSASVKSNPQSSQPTRSGCVSWIFRRSRRQRDVIRPINEAYCGKRRAV